MKNLFHFGLIISHLDVLETVSLTCIHHSTASYAARRSMRLRRSVWKSCRKRNELQPWNFPIPKCNVLADCDKC